MTIGTQALRAARDQFSAAIDLVLDELKNPDIAEEVKFSALETMGDLETAAKFSELGELLNPSGEPKPAAEGNVNLDPNPSAEDLDAVADEQKAAAITAGEPEQDPAPAGIDAPVDGSPDASMEPAAS